MASRQHKAWTYRVENIPYGTTAEELIEKHFSCEDQDHISVKSIFPSVEAVEGEEEKSELTATVLFKPPTPRPEGPHVPESSDITVTKHFQGFTPLYVPPTGTKIDADVIAITGLAGHAYGSWAWSEERMWLRDDLKKDITNARILTYGYDSEVKNSTSFGIIKDHGDNFLEDLINMRDSGKCENRPIAFIGHSLGCLIIKKVNQFLSPNFRRARTEYMQAMIEAWDRGIHGARLPVRAIVFLAAPHRGLDVQALQTLVKQTPSEQLVSELKKNSPTLRDLNTRFRRFGDEINILTCYEMKQTKTVVETKDGSWERKGEYVTMVDQESATLSYLKEKAKGVAEDHSKIAKIRRTQGGIYPNIRSAIKCALRPTVTVADEHQTSSLRAQELAHGQATVPWPSPYHHGEPYSQGHTSQHLEATSSSMYFHGEAGGLHVSGTPCRPTTPSRTWPRHLTRVPAQISHRSLSDGTLVSLGPPQDFPSGSHSRSLTPQPPMRSQSQPEAVAVPTSEPELNLGMKVESVSEQELEYNLGAESEPQPEMIPAPEPAPEPEVKVAMSFEELSATRTEPKAQPGAKLESNQDSRPHQEDPEGISDQDYRPVLVKLDRELARDPSQKLETPEREPDLGTAAEQEKTRAAAEPHEALSEAAMPENAETARYTISNSPTAHEQSNNDAKNIKKKTEVAITQNSLVASCTKCSLPILNSEPHYLYHPLEDIYSRCCESCDRESHLAGETSWCCHDCAFKAQFKCPMHRSKMEPMIIAIGPYSERIIPHISELVSASDNRILAAIKRNDTGLLQLLVENESLLVSQNSTGQTPLHLAAQLGRGDCARILLSAEPHFKEQQDVHGNTPLMLAVEYENLGVVKALAEHRVDIDTVSKQGSALSRAVFYGLADFVEELVKRNAKIENPDYNGSPLLYVAACKGDERTTRALLAASSIDVDVQDSFDGNFPLLAASARGHGRIVKMLLDKNVDVHAVNKKDERALHWACFWGCTEAARMLLATGADSDIKRQDWNGDTPLHSASRRDSLGNFEIARELVGRYNAELEIKNHEGRTPLHLAMAANSYDLFEFLLDSDADFRTADTKGNTILHIAAWTGKWKFCRTLVSLRFNAELEVKNQDTETPLLLAVGRNKPRVVDVLLEAGAAINTTNIDGTQPLHIACSNGYLEICRTLVSHKANLKAKDKEGRNPLHLAVLNNHLDVVKYLLNCDQAPHVDEVAEDGYSSLHYAAEKGHSEICAALLDHKASMTELTKFWDTPVMLAAHWGENDCLKVFIEYNADLNYEYRGYNAVWCAAFRGLVKTVKFLLENDASGLPPSALKGEWELMKFDSDVDGAMKSQVLNILEKAMHK